MRVSMVSGRFTRSLGWAAAALAVIAVTVGAPHAASAEEVVRIGYLGLEPPDQEPLSLLEPETIPDHGVEGARLALTDNNATGRFTGQSFEMEEVILPRDGDVETAFRDLAANGAAWILADLPADALTRVAALEEAQDRIIFNVSARDDALRAENCAANVFHTTPSYTMLSDALAQFLVAKRWNRWLLVVGSTEEDALFADAVRHSATKFGGQIVAEKMWPHTPMARRAEGGFHAIQREIPVFVQDVRDYDVLVVVDVNDYFGEYFPYQTWLPRPVVGTQGLIPTAWHRTHESWGAVQIQRRFERQAERWMTPKDFAAWIAVRALGEAATRTRSVEPDALVDYILDPDFGIGAYLGEPVSFRAWDHQLRQPVLLAGPRMMVSVSPQEGFLHPVTPLDTLGYDEPEGRCNLD